ncbi:hypothetical protein PRRU23_24770 [Segatella bryantii]|uniref:Uncharacterized protein n=1 Tax=Segatella bryantii TaxID=77095 RepID=A0AA37MMC9_SEGBR|nr:hypothetical protein PRRU23_24770 [Segatella bryantii]
MNRVILNRDKTYLCKAIGPTIPIKTTTTAPKVNITSLEVSQNAGIL